MAREAQGSVVDVASGVCRGKTTPAEVVEALRSLRTAEALTALVAEHDALEDRVRRVLAASVEARLNPPSSAATQLPPRRAQAEAGASSSSSSQPANPPRNDAATPASAHMELQRAVLTLLIQTAPMLQFPARPDMLLGTCCERFREVAAARHQLGPGNVQRALLELQGLVPYAIRVDPSGLLLWVEPSALFQFQQRLISSGPARPPQPSAAAGPSVGLSGGGGGSGGGSGGGGGGGGGGKKRSAAEAAEDGLAEALDLVGRKSFKQAEKQGAVDGGHSNFGWRSRLLMD